MEENTEQGKTLINNVAYSWSMIQLSAEALGEDMFIDCTSIKWSAERKVDNIYGLGGQPRKRGFGNVTYDASIILPLGTQLMLISKSTSGTLMGLGEFDLVISWVNDLAKNVSSNTVTLQGCFFSQAGMDASQDDTSITKEFDLHPYRIYTNETLTKNTSWCHELYGGV